MNGQRQPCKAVPEKQQQRHVHAVKGRAQQARAAVARKHAHAFAHQLMPAVPPFPQFSVPSQLIDPSPTLFTPSKLRGMK